MVLYRYMRSHWIETLSDKRFKMAKISDFNDPFDGRGRCVGQFSKDAVKNIARESNIVSKQFLDLVDKSNIPDLTDQILDILVNTYSTGFYRHVQDRSIVNLITYVLCFSACKDVDPNQKLMWAHYAGGHSGVRIGVRFDDPNFPSYLDSVKYCHERPILDLSKVRSLNNDSEMLRFWISNLTTKSTEWAYEQEVRLIVDDKHLEKGVDDKGDEAYYWQFSPQNIASVDVGCQMPQAEIKKIIELRNSKYPHVSIRQVVLNDSDYGISYKSLI